MPRFTKSDDLQGAEFVETNLRGARFTGADLSGVVMRSIETDGLEIDSPWIFESEKPLLVNGVDVLPLVDAALDRRFPGRGERRAGDPDGLRAAWAAVERTWSTTLERAASMPAGTVDLQVDDEWSFAQTLRHLVMATDIWLGIGILELEPEAAYHPFGQPYAEFEADGHDTSILTSTTPTYDEVLEARAGRVAMVRDFIAAATPEQLAAGRRNPHSPEHPETVLSCLHVILNEEWEHHRYAVRDLEAIEARSRS
jgi:hypothetical protein